MWSVQAIHKPESWEVGCQSQFGCFLPRNADWLCVCEGTARRKRTLHWSVPWTEVQGKKNTTLPQHQGFSHFPSPPLWLSFFFFGLFGGGGWVCLFVWFGLVFGFVVWQMQGDSVFSWCSWTVDSLLSWFKARQVPCSCSLPPWWDGEENWKRTCGLR